MITRPFALRLSAVALTGLLALGACSSTTAPPTTTGGATTATSAAPSSAAPATSAATSAAPASTAPQSGATVSVDTFAARMTKAATSFKTAAVDMSIDTAQGGTKAKGVMDQTDPKNRKMKLAMTISGREMEMILVDGQAYMTSPTAPGKYIKLPSDQVASTVNNLDLAQQINQLKSSITTVTFVGSENVGGAPADHYQYKATASGTPITGDIWFDARDRPVQAKTALAQGATTLTYSNFDAPVTITAPPADQIVG
ncbi:MAG TPA: hypothetical protein PLA44_07070 [Propionibacteriaceae bacterium]|nr:hypothetical protein [Propionibacteriaceae bacterium]